MSARIGFVHSWSLQILVLFLGGCVSQIPVAELGQRQRVIDRETPFYEIILGRALNDRMVTSFLTNNNCVPSGPFQVCQAAGFALWTTHHRIVQEIFLYVEDTEGFSQYTGTFPFGLTSKDTRADVEQKLGQPKVPHMPQWGWEPGLPDTGGTPDYIHYWAIYMRFNLTIVYNSPSASDPGATIHMILINFESEMPPGGHTYFC